MKRLLVMIAMVAIAGLALAAPTWDNGGAPNYDWQTAANWDSDAVPVDGDRPTIGSGAIVVITTDDPNDYSIRIQMTGGTVSHTGGTLGGNTSAAYQLAVRNGTYTLDGGTIAMNGPVAFTYSATSTATFELVSGSVEPLSSASVLMGNNNGNNAIQLMKISGGTLGGKDIVMNGIAGANTGCAEIFQVIGNDATISITDDILLGNANATIAPIIKLDFEADGISLIDVADDIVFTLGSAPTIAELEIDVTAVGSAAVATYDLIRYGGTLADTFGAVDVVDYAGAMSEGTWGSLGAHEYALNYGDGDDDVIQLQIVTIPEPAFLGLLGLAVLAWIRRK